MAGLAAQDFCSRNRDQRTRSNVQLQQLAVVHLISVIAAQNKDVLRAYALDRIDVLINRVSCPLIPLFRCAELGWNRKDEFSALVGEDVPAQAYMSIE